MPPRPIERPGLSLARAQQARRLLTAKGRASIGAFLTEGPQAVREALAWGDVRQVIVSASATPVALELAEVASGKGVAVAMGDDELMSSITDTVRGQGIVAVCGLPRSGLDDAPHPRLVLVLDEVRDPGNVGTLIRTADAFGADAVVATVGTAEPWSPKAVRASVGSVFHLPVVTQVGFEDVVGWAGRCGLSVLAADAGGRPLNDPELTQTLAGPVAWVVGNEAAGLSSSHVSMVDEIVAVPMWGKAESLNVATAAGVCLYMTALRQNV